MTTQNNQPKQAISRAQKAKTLAHRHQLMLFESTRLYEEDFWYLSLYLKFGVEPECRKTLSEVDGFLHAIAIGPVTLEPEQWLPKLLGPKSSQTEMRSAAKRVYNIAEVLIRIVNGIVEGQMLKPQVTRLCWGAVIDEYNEQKYDDAVGWARGFFNGMRLCWGDWQGFLDTPKGKRLIWPIALLGEKECHVNQDKLTSTAAMRADLAQEIIPSIPGIFNHWRGTDAN